MFLTDVFLIEQLTVLSEDTNGINKTKVQGIFQRADEANNNGRTYPRAILEGQVKKLQKKINERTLCGELDHPQNDSVKLSNASHLITKLYMRGPEVIGEAEILNTPAGLTAKALIEGGVKIGISSRGTGTISEGSDGAKIVNEDFNMVTFDLVADPSTRAAYPGMCESTESQLISSTMDKFGKEKNFLTMLEAKLSESAISDLGDSSGRKRNLLKKATALATGSLAGAMAAGGAAAKFKGDKDGLDDRGRTRSQAAQSAAVQMGTTPDVAKKTIDRANKIANERAARAKKKDEAEKKKAEKEAEAEKRKADSNREAAKQNYKNKFSATAKKVASNLKRDLTRDVHDPSSRVKTELPSDFKDIPKSGGSKKGHITIRNRKVIKKK